MRNLFICFLLATLAGLVQRGPDPVIEPATYLGILVVFPILGARLFRNLRLPPAVGAIAGGAFLNQLGLLDTGLLVSVASFKQVGFIWLGLFLGVRVSGRPTWTAPNAVSAVAIVVACALLVCAAVSVYPLTLLEKLQIGLAAAVCAPVYTALERDHHRDEVGLAGLATAIAIVLLCATNGLHLLANSTFLAKGSLVAVVVIIGAEIAFRAVKSAVSGPGRYLVYILLTGALWRGSLLLGIHPGLAGSAFGILLGLRAQRWQDTTAPLAEASSFAGSFVLGFVSAELNWAGLLHSPAEAWALGALITVAMLAGKGGAGLVAGRLTRFNHHQWMTVYPLGLSAIVILPTVLPERLFLGLVAQPEEALLPVILICAVGIPLLTCLISRLSDYIASRRNAAASSGGMELT